ncbi:MAG: SUMF1/EgtB/PvdO family nonheme iron enzyme [Candidatus Thiothrix moscowensis]|nr:SUMF1/EgtB/PvdO family nonheme iron enzyme [Candidatus Thiothrix moscowensis]
MQNQPPSLKLVRVFLASPGDVAEERKIAADLLDTLQNSPLWREKLKFETVIWERPGSGAPMLAHLAPQQAIAEGRPKPSECDIVIVIFWSRMGTPLPADFALKADGSQYQSGSEWEFWDAVNVAKQHHGHPRVLLYRRDEEPQIGFRDANRAEKLAQWDKVEQFFASLKGDDGSIRHSHTSYALPNFATQLRADLEAVLDGLLIPAAKTTTQPHNIDETRPLPAIFTQLWQQVIASTDEEAGENFSLDLTAQQLRDIRDHRLQDLRQYRLSRIAEWSQPRYQLDKRFTPLTLMLFQEDQGYVPQAQVEITDLRQLFDKQADVTAFVVLGAPGSGKSTLLRRLELDLACDALRLAEQDAATQAAAAVEYLSFYLSLNSYQGVAGAEPPPPQQWLEQHWAASCPNLPPLPDVLQTRQVVFLLDALNEMPHRDFADFQHKVAAWQYLIQHYAHRYRHCRFVFSCRTLDYSSTLSSETLVVPHVRIERLSEAQISEFLRRYAPTQADDLFAAIKQQRQLDLYSTPYFLRLLIEQAQRSGKVPRGRAALFTGFVREVLGREYKKANPLLLNHDHKLLSERELKKLARQVDAPTLWADDCALPEQGVLFPELARLAYVMQERGIRNETAQVSIGYDEALDCVQCQDAEMLLAAGVALGILDEDQRNDRIQFVHQLLQEYFAARRLARQPDPERVRSIWQADQASPSLQETLAGLADYEPLPPPRTTGWEETTVMAAAMTPDVGAYLRALAETNLPLAGRTAAQDGLAVTASLKNELRTRLIQRCEDGAADIRHRIAAGRALGELGDPRFVEQQGEFGRYLLPPMVEIEGETYQIGSDEGLFNNESPVHAVKLPAFQLGQFPVTNAEWACFMAAGGYEDERWWQGEEALAWFRGETTAEGPRQQWREEREYIQKNLEAIRRWPEQGKITSKQLEDWETIAGWNDQRFEEQLEEWCPAGKQTQPANWNDSTYNHLQHPVVGICWLEAKAYCCWLSAQTSREYVLPTEAQWEAAARGIDQRRYAWGEDFDNARCNTFESHIRGTTPVGVFPQGQTPVTELHDMSGNVWEWTSTAYQAYPYQPDDGREDQLIPGGFRRVSRGGSWLDSQGFARAARRYGNPPSYRYDGLGCRVCCLVSPPI